MKSIYLKPIFIIQSNWWQLTILTAFLIGLASLWPADQLPEVPGTDKTHHLIAYCLLAFPIALAKPSNWLFLIVLVIGYGGMIELIQPYVNRYGEWLDLLANTTGVLIGIGLGLLLRKRIS